MRLGSEDGADQAEQTRKGGANAGQCRRQCRYSCSHAFEQLSSSFSSSTTEARSVFPMRLKRPVSTQSPLPLGA